MNNLLVNNNIKQKYSDTVPISQAFLYDKCQGLLYFSEMDEKNIDNDVAVFIKQSRKYMKMTQEVFAEKFGCTKANVSAWENALHEPSYRQLRNISEVSGVPLPHDKIGAVLSKLGIDAQHIDVDQIEILKESLDVPKQNRAQVKRVISTFKEPDTKTDEENSVKK